MKKMFFLILLFSFFAHAKTVLVSDIDDTIKVSHVLNNVDAIVHAFNTDNYFINMSELYQLIATNDPTTSFYYVTNAPKQFMEKSHAEFLAKWKFPEGKLILRSNLPTTDHKPKTIQKIIQREKPDLLIVLGDNGERDIEVYDNLAKANPNLRVIQFIRILYSKQQYPNVLRIKENQLNFVTPFDIAFALVQMQVLRGSESLSFLLDTANEVVQSDDITTNGVPTYFANWMNCQDFIWQWQLPMGFKKYIEKINSRCGL